MQSFNKVVNPGSIKTYGDRWAKVYVNIEYNAEDDELSITGVVGPLSSGNAIGSCGQIQDELLNIEKYEDGWDYDKVRKLQHVWENYHLNGMHAGTMEQERLVREYFQDNDMRYDYQKAYDYLKSINMHHHLDVHYGYQWLHWPIPEYVLGWLFNLPDTNSTPAWV